MASEVVDTIVLSGEDSINFANNLLKKIFILQI